MNHFMTEHAPALTWVSPEVGVKKNDPPVRDSFQREALRHKWTDLGQPGFPDDGNDRQCIGKVQLIDLLVLIRQIWIAPVASILLEQLLLSRICLG